jgi:hypothetical protein
MIDKGYEDSTQIQVHLRFSYILNCLKLFLRHDIKSDLKYNDKSLLKQMGIYNQTKFKIACEKIEKFGIFETKILLSFALESGEFKTDIIDDSIELLQEFLILYKSETNYLGNKTGTKFFF